MRKWALQDAKARLGSVVGAGTEKPQTITLNGKPEIVVLRPGPRTGAGGQRLPMTLYEALRACPYEIKIPKLRGRFRPIDL